MGIKKEAFGKMQDGTNVYLYTLTNKNGSIVKITNYGGIVVSIMVPNRDGELGDVVLGFDQLEDYLKDSPYFGCIAGRYANRIAGGKFTLDGVEYKLAQNDGKNHLHGGERGFDKVVWDAGEIVRKDCVGLQMDYTSRDGEEGYPGTLHVTVTYLWTHKDELKIEYSAVTDRKTVVNLTNHSYFNLAGAGTGDILRHELTIYGHQFTPVDRELIPYGELRSVTFSFGNPNGFYSAKYNWSQNR
jgi:aldose 1-epimerase